MTSFTRKTDNAIMSGVLKNIPVPNFSSIGAFLIFDPLDDDVIQSGDPCVSNGKIILFTPVQEHSARPLRNIWSSKTHSCLIIIPVPPNIKYFPGGTENDINLPPGFLGSELGVLLLGAKINFLFLVKN